ncbi:MAG: NAD(P)/FAD-dependent oxidoreductase [Dehalococcoidia bacterium]|nr:NAD(P)/FAD-dependent oxidoreductase [Dehalococcoidia bacterium]
MFKYMDIDVAIIGAGIVGLAVAAEVAQPDRSVYVIEKNERFGLETSSRNSGVVHAGLYYPPGSLKAKLCVEGNLLIQEMGSRLDIDFQKLGKIVVATNNNEVHELEALFSNAIANGVTGLRWLSHNELKQLEPNVEGLSALLSANTGVVDAYKLMKYMAWRARDRGAGIVYRTEVTGISRQQGLYRLYLNDTQGGSVVNSRVVINCAGLQSDKIAALAGIDVDEAGYRIYYCKGQYFSVTGTKRQLVKRLIFPVPEHLGPGLGIHVVKDPDGRLRLGPDAKYVSTIDYSVDDTDRTVFCNSVRPFLPFIDYEDLEPESAGIRPKLQKPGGPFRDFVIKEESSRGLPGLINLIGIESPGLTAAPAIGRYVFQLVKQFFDNN